MRRRSVLTAVAALTAATTVLTGCGSSSSAGSSSGALTGTITVFAAASLTESFTTLGRQFENAHPGTKITFSFGASGTLVTQITQGAPADVFASASTKTMDALVTQKAVGAPVTFATNVPQIAVPPDNPAGIATVADLAKPGVKVALCANTVPIGALAEQVFGKAGVTVKPASIEKDAKATLTKVELGEVDAGIVYVTDVKAAGDKVKGIPIPAELSGSTKYPIAPVSSSKNTALAQAFVDYVLSADGSAVLTAQGFQRP